MAGEVDLTPEVPGTSVTYVAAATAGNTYTNHGIEMIHLKVSGATAAVVVATVEGVAACNQGTVHDVTAAVATASDMLLGPYDTARFNNATTGKVTIHYDGVDTLTVAIISPSA